MTTLSSDEQAMHSLAHDFFAGEASLDRQHETARALAVSGQRPSNERAQCVQMAKLDFFSQAAPEDLGGVGLTPLASGLIAEAAGAELVPGAWFDQLASIRLLAPLGADVLRPIISAERLVALSFDAPSTGLRWDSSGSTVSGVVTGLHFGDTADLWAVLANDTIIVIDPRAPGVSGSVQTAGLDPLSYTVTAQLHEVRPDHMLRLDRADHAALYAHVCALVAAYAVGAATRCLEIAVAYVKEREQFGRAVGSFQAVKHRAANAAVDLLHTRSLARSAIADASGASAHEARIAADRCFRMVAESALQMHGGIGFTSDVPIHLFLKSAQRLRGWPRPVDESFDAVRTALGLDTEPLSEDT